MADVNIRGVKTVVGSPVQILKPDGSPYYGEVKYWHNRIASNTIEVWKHGFTIVFDRDAISTYEGLYTVHSSVGPTPDSPDAMYDLNGDWRNGTQVVFASAWDDTLRGLPTSFGYIYAATISDNGGHNLTLSELSALGGSEPGWAGDVHSFNFKFSAMPLGVNIYTIKLYYMKYV